ncbi:hypothetical protein [Terrihabitans rhizophilus]|uniref:ABC transporter permease n=1 Tax=Terrihabitans rhizophilus TaxID=3092662 RepID=A0ABU4RKD8_9HYPH|nr:hypothetical protein [Terrihabitans sp. PJ23]MDX6804658.1 hypothetical protein [Terrihabitans sp. PJ23]
MSSADVLPSKRERLKRIVFACLPIYLDFLLVWTVVHLCSYFMGLGTEGYGITAVSALVALAQSKLELSPGVQLLEPAQVESAEGRRTWPNLLLGTLLILEGTKNLVRWTELEAVLPVYGLVDTSPLKILLLLAIGSLSIAAGILLLRFTRLGLALAAAMIVVDLGSIIVGWPLFSDAIAKVTIARRELQGLPVRPGEIEFMQTVMPAWLLVALALFMVLLTFARVRRA